ncbi:tetratricopeptide repeat-containing sensor histidine kinase [Gilvibacter sp.]|uniref:tetratricopeptide repeat-containing sensor histidine kinase n=1 Tax=Gilvibacter sp. TaxID=2729997 RepID=UPI003B51B8D1
MISLIASTIYAQVPDFDSAEKLLDSKEFEVVIDILEPWANSNSESKAGLARGQMLLGQAYLALDKHDKAFKNFLDAKQNWRAIDSLYKAADANLMVIETLSHQKAIKSKITPYLDELVQFATDKDDPSYLTIAYGRLATSFNHADDMENAIAFYDKAIALAYSTGDTLRAISQQFNKGVAYNSSEMKMYKQGIEAFTIAAEYFLKKNQKQYLAFAYNNLGESYAGLKDYDKALIYYLKADSIPIETNVAKTKRIIYGNLEALYRNKEDYRSVVYYLEKQKAITDSTEDRYQNLNIEVAEAKTQLAESEKETIIQQQKSSRNKNIAFGLGGTLFLGSIIAFLVYRNTKRKQRIAEQEKEIEVQKTEKLLKEQELNTIDAMIAGQEKERQRLASDLHDSVGATLSAAKMQFEHLKKHRGSLNNEDELYDRTQLLLEEAYTEVRAMAHAKNSGVIAKNGLLPAVNKLAQNASATGKIQIEVQDYGLDQRLEGSLEIAVFRIIQELVTNIIKHAEATEASISLTQHEDAINVVVEDNGKGFKAGKLSNNSGGMGLGSIEKRVEHMEGQMEVDSTPGKGTSVIIDIPL